MLNLENWAWAEGQLVNIAKRAQQFNLHSEERKSEGKKGKEKKNKEEKGEKREFLLKFLKHVFKGIVTAIFLW